MIKRREKIKNRNKVKDYINNERMYEEVKIYLERLKLAKEKGTKLPQMPNYLGECFLKIGTNFANRHTYRNYPHLDEMIADGVFFCVKGLDSFDVNKFDNPFAFFTQCVYFAFLQRIDKEKKVLYAKYKSMINSSIMQEIADHQGIDDTYDDLIISPDSSDNMNAFIASYDETLRKRKEKKTKDEDNLEEESTKDIL